MIERIKPTHFNEGNNCQTMLKQGKYLALQWCRFVLMVIFAVILLLNSCFAQLLVIANKNFPESQLTSQSLLALYTYSNHFNSTNVTTIEQADGNINSIFYNALGVDTSYITRTRAQAQFSSPLGFNAPLVLTSAQAVLETVEKHRNDIGYIVVSPEQLLSDDVKIIYQAPTNTNSYQSINTPTTTNHLQTGDICYLEHGKKVCLG